MSQHHFLFEPGLWIGEGTVSFSASPDSIKFYTKWTISPEKDKKIQCTQIVEMQESQEHVQNRFTLSDITPQHFLLSLENDLVSRVHGKGIIDEKTIAWEFRSHPNFEGFEVYELQDNGDYLLHAEYASPDLFRTTIKGRIWKQEGKEEA